MWQEAGPEARLDEFVEQLPLAESRDYVKRVLVLADSYRQLYPELSAGGTASIRSGAPAGAALGAGV